MFDIISSLSFIFAADAVGSIDGCHNLLSENTSNLNGKITFKGQGHSLGDLTFRPSGGGYPEGHHESPLIVKLAGERLLPNMLLACQHLA